MTQLQDAIILTNTDLYKNTITNTAICPQRFGLWHLLRFSLKIEAAACPVPWLSCWDGTSIQDIYRTIWRMVYNKIEIQAHKNTNTSTLRCRTMDTITAARYKGTPAWREKKLQNCKEYIQTIVFLTSWYFCLKIHSNNDGERSLKKW